MAETYEAPHEVSDPLDEQAFQPPEEPKEPQAPERPEWLPEKFKSPEDLALSYASLEARLAAGAPKTPEGTEAQATPQGTQGPKVLDEVVMQQLYNEYADKGTLSPQTYAMLVNDYNLPESVVNAHIGALRGKAEADAESLYALVGGKDEYNRMAAWAGREMPAEKRAAYDDMIAAANATGNRDLVAMAIEAMAVQWRESEGSPTPRAGTFTPQSGGPNGPDQGFGPITPYPDMESFHADQRKPEYHTSAAFRNHVIARFGRSGL